MEVRDPVHGSIHILDEEIAIIQHDFFQRLRNIKQLGFSEFVFPGATHTRFIHSIGVMCIGEKAFDKLFKSKPQTKDILRIKETFKLACLLHDIGHGPLSHSTESVMPNLDQIQMPDRFLSKKDKNSKRQATHEDYTIKAITDSSFSESFNDVERVFGVRKENVADLIRGESDGSDYFTIEGIDYFILLHQLVSGELDCDRMDYLLRDSYFCGVSYGSYDLDWLLDNLEPAIIDNKAYLGISERAVVTFDDFLLSRYHMFVMVYFHYRSVCLEQLLFKYFKTSPGEYTIPANIEEYIEHDDHFLMKIMRNSSNPIAQSIVKNKIPKKIYESFNKDQTKHLEEIQAYFEKEGIEFIRCSSKSRLSKYYNEDTELNNFSMKVVRTIHGSDSKEYFNINMATDLFSKFSNAHSINRLHCNIDLLSESQKTEVERLMRS
ncbi:hypothetical protein A9Q84_07630 [Halobacteriovorax marinus]|uniref:HD/PDEase domain-containing protein n=1 Tax=Halobacteriovorax marinus TaxID=97084 RepID=A0A1Y5FBI9_9BACT|nr:hypothetical protein A9Q84_07630 [Halobacteriovorax marinus]